MAELFIFSGKGDLFSSWEISEILSQRGLRLEEPASPPWPEEQGGVLYGEEEGAEPSGGNPGCGPNCARFYMHGLIHKSPEKDGIDLGGQGPISRRRKFQH